MHSESPLRFNFASPAALITAMALIGTATYFGHFFWTGRDFKQQLDRQIEEDWIYGREVVDAVEFFEKGGVYENQPGEGAEDIDRKFLLPLVKRLRNEYGLTVLAVKRDDAPNMAMAVIAEAPKDQATRNRVRAAILETADAFPGFAMQNWSHRWVSIDLFDEQELKVFPAKTLEKLRAGQRRME